MVQSPCLAVGSISSVFTVTPRCPVLWKFSVKDVEGRLLCSTAMSHHSPRPVSILIAASFLIFLGVVTIYENELVKYQERGGTCFA